MVSTSSQLMSHCDTQQAHHIGNWCHTVVLNEHTTHKTAVTLWYSTSTSHSQLLSRCGIQQAHHTHNCCHTVVLSEHIALSTAGDAGAQIEQLLLGSISSPQEASRLCAVQWANRLFPFSHVPARYICAMAAGDPKLEVREEGQAGLAPPKPQAASATSKAPVVLRESDTLQAVLWWSQAECRGEGPIWAWPSSASSSFCRQYDTWLVIAVGSILSKVLQCLTQGTL